MVNGHIIGHIGLQFPSLRFVANKRAHRRFEIGVPEAILPSMHGEFAAVKLRLHFLRAGSARTAVAGVPIMVGWRNGYELNVLRMYQSATAVHPISHKPTSGP